MMKIMMKIMMNMKSKKFITNKLSEEIIILNQIQNQTKSERLTELINQRNKPKHHQVINKTNMKFINLVVFQLILSIVQ